MATSYAGTFNDTQTGLTYYSFTTVDTVTRNARYFSNIYFQDTNEYLYVQNGIFLVND